MNKVPDLPHSTPMSKAQFLTELDKLLIFMRSADREKTLARYGALFDQAGPAGQEPLWAALGSPTRQAIRLSRIYDPAGSYEDEFLDSLEASGPVSEPAPAPEPEETASEPAPAVPDPLSRIQEDLPDFDLADLPELASLPDKPAPAPEPEETAPAVTPAEAEAEPPAPQEEPAAPEAQEAEEPAQEPPAEEAAPEAPEPEKEEPDEAQVPEAEAPSEMEPAPAPVSQPPRTRVYVDRAVPLWAGIPLFILSLLVLALPLGALCLVLLPLYLLPGLGLLLGAWLSFVGALWCLSYIADAAILFGLALIVLAAGLVVLWLGLWLDVLMVKVCIRGMRALIHLTLGKKVVVRA